METPAQDAFGLSASLPEFMHTLVAFLDAVAFLSVPQLFWT